MSPGTRRGLESGNRNGASFGVMLSLVSGFELVATRMLLLVSFFTSDAKHSQLVYKNLRPKSQNVEVEHLATITPKHEIGRMNS